MFRLLVILFFIKLYAHTDIFEFTSIILTTNCLSVFDYFVVLELKRLRRSSVDTVILFLLPMLKNTNFSGDES